MCPVFFSSVGNYSKICTQINMVTKIDKSLKNNKYACKQPTHLSKRSEMN